MAQKGGGGGTLTLRQERATTNHTSLNNMVSAQT
jgi:hypothetical protein